MRLILRPKLLLLYLLVYWGGTLFAACAVASVALWLLGHARGAAVFSGLALLCVGFNLGVVVGETGPPPGRRR